LFRSFATAAIIYDIGISEETSPLLDLLLKLDFTSIGDIPSTISNSAYQLTSNGMIFDFSTLSAAPIPFLLSSPVRNLSPASSNALNKVTTIATAGSNQRKVALEHRFIELGFSLADPATFLTIIRSKDIVVPIDVGDLARSMNNPSFPTPLACSSNLTSRQLDDINLVENKVFGLPPLSSSNPTPSVNCNDRPIYGFINLFNLRLPFLPPPPGTLSKMPQQAIVLSNSTQNRMTIHGGSTLVEERYIQSATLIASSESTPSSPSSPSLPDRFGIPSQLNHIIISYLSLISPAIAKLLINFILLGNDTPPAINSILFEASKNLSMIPILELQLWGGISQNEIIRSISGFTSLSSNPIPSSILPSDTPTLFFDSREAQLFRDWSRRNNQNQGKVEWSLNAMESGKVVDDIDGTDNAGFDVIWKGTRSGGGEGVKGIWNSCMAAGLVVQ
jgi:hypothetical protein